MERTSPAGSRTEILVVGDSLETPRLEDALDDAGIDHAIRVAATGQEGIDFVYRRGEFADAPRPDLVLLSLSVSGVDGKAVLGKFTDDPDLRRIPVVACADPAADEGALRSHDLEADAYLSTPIEPDEFVELVRSHAGGS